MKINITTILFIIICVLGLVVFLQSNNEPEVKTEYVEVVKEIPAKEGTILDKSNLQPVRDTVFKEKYIYVPRVKQADTTLLNKYRREVDSLQKELMYKEAITKNSYLERYEDKFLIVDISAETTGVLDELGVAYYKIKKDSITVTNKETTITNRGTNLWVGGELGLPNKIGYPFVLKAQVMLQKKNLMYSLGADLNKTVYVGLYYNL